MANMGEIQVQIRPQLSIDKDTANTCLRLLELYCDANHKIIKHMYSADEIEGEYRMKLKFVDDTSEDFFPETK